MNDALHALIEKHEGRRHKPYLDSVGKWTIGIGRNLDDVGLDDAEIEFLFERDVNEAWEDCSDAIENWSTLSDNRRNALCDMRFNLGAAGFRRFEKMLAAVAVEDFETAADEMINSRWSSQVGKRATELADMMRAG